jgi:hypothetical protein
MLTDWRMTILFLSLNTTLKGLKVTSAVSNMQPQVEP